MRTKTQPQKVETINPNTGRKMNIDQKTYDLFSKAIYHTLLKGQPLTYTQMVEGVKDCFRAQHTVFDGSVEWYAVSVKNDMQSRGVIEAYRERGRKLHRLK